MEKQFKLSDAAGGLLITGDSATGKTVATRQIVADAKNCNLIIAAKPSCYEGHEVLTEASELISALENVGDNKTLIVIDGILYMFGSDAEKVLKMVKKLSEKDNVFVVFTNSFNDYLVPFNNVLLLRQSHSTILSKILATFTGIRLDTLKQFTGYFNSTFVSFKFA